LRRDLRDTLQKKRLLDRNLASIEDNIYRQETTYLEETSVAGNIVKGFDNYIKASATASASAGTVSGSAIGGGLGASRRKAAINDSDRIFSRSSTSYMRDSDSPGSSSSTPNHAATPTGSFTADNKKKKKNTTEEDADTKADARSQKRQKISFGAGRKGTQDD
jgi:chromatin modification-related protein EAF6